jgi:ABC-type transport system involved in multi-copper enzyme maturation permease subunit
LPWFHGGRGTTKMTFIQPLDLKEIFMGTFAGGEMIFFFVMFIVIAMLAARFRFSNINLMIMIALFAIFMAAWAEWLYVGVIIVAGLVLGLLVSRIWKS